MYKLSHFYGVYDPKNGSRYLVISQSQKDRNRPVQYLFTEEDLERANNLAKVEKKRIPYEASHPVTDEPYTPFIFGVVGGICLSLSAIWFYVHFLGTV